MRGWTLDLRNDAGSTLLLTIFYSVLSLTLILLISAASSLYLERKRLLTLADGAALVGAEAFDLTQVASSPTGPRVLLTRADVAAAVDAYLAAVPHTFEDLAVERAEPLDGRGATVALSAYWRPPMLSLLVPEGLRIEVEANARSVIG